MGGANRKTIEDYTVITHSDAETIELGQKLGTLLEDGDVVAQVGELGSGKTWFAKGMALGLGVSAKNVVTSPSFSLVNEYEGRHTFYHMDLYRLESLPELLAAGLEEYLYSGGVVAMEWADRWPEILPEACLMVKLVILDDNQREITFSGQHQRAVELITTMEMKKDLNATL